MEREILTQERQTSFIPIAAGLIVLSITIGVLSIQPPPKPQQHPTRANLPNFQAPPVESTAEEIPDSQTGRECATVEDAKKSLDRCRQLASDADRIIAGSGATTASGSERMIAWFAEEHNWAAVNSERFTSCESSFSAHGTMDLQQIPTTLENLQIAGGWLEKSVQFAASGDRKDARIYLKGAHSAIRKAKKVIERKTNNSSIIKTPRDIEKLESQFHELTPLPTVLPSL